MMVGTCTRGMRLRNFYPLLTGDIIFRVSRSRYVDGLEQQIGIFWTGALELATYMFTLLSHACQFSLDTDSYSEILWQLLEI